VITAIEGMIPIRRVGTLLSLRVSSNRTYFRPSHLKAFSIVSATSNSSLRPCQHHQIRSHNTFANANFDNEKIPSYIKDGDWICLNCQAHNFASRAQCFDCQSPIDQGRILYKKGGWHCPTCNLPVRSIVFILFVTKG